MNFSIVNSSTAGWWYVLFVNSEGEKCFFPIKQKLAGKWNINNCPKLEVRYRFGVYEVPDLGVKTPQEILKEFERQHTTPEEYLKKLDN